ncbi:MAG: biotin synthase BioB [Nitrososphaeria archaeon]|nr:biotin synthase BioB [Nitrososphaeria archaeon]NDB50691.1 biotin synthase BioB [Nitrosopumilaceae archaeon]NDB87468.1 biotin synthase BioB [Nitrososphaerota archaeon]NDB46670.1 biotin synthase BioB [Nitrososphaeria archaeon]NDB89617.1 biotin synthase BioB [Nitrososphaerota archaeon]
MSLQILDLQNKVLDGKKLTSSELEILINTSDLKALSDSANKITRAFQGNKVDVEQLANIKKNYCSEDCVFCGQSAFFNTGIDSYQLLPAEEILQMAKKAKEQGAESYCLVAAWRQPSDVDFIKVCDIIAQIRDTVGISIECSLGFLTQYQAKRLKELGVKRYNHNLETARSKFPQICTTHTYQDRLDTLEIARNAGLELCTGGIIGMGETRAQRLELITDLARIEPEEVTINLLVAIPGTPLELQTPISFEEILRVFAVTRFALPKSIIKISGGREVHLEDSGEELLLSGANGIISAGYLTLGGNPMNKDLEMIRKINLEAKA